MVVDRVLDHAQATSGVAVSGECMERYQELKLKKQHKYVVYKLSPNMAEIVVDKSSKETDYETFLEDLPSDEPRWAVYDFEYSKGDAGKRNKLVFYSWCAPPEIQSTQDVTSKHPFVSRRNPDGAKIKQKMVYASSRDTLRRALVGIAAEIQGTDKDEVGHETGTFCITVLCRGMYGTLNPRFLVSQSLTGSPEVHEHRIRTRSDYMSYNLSLSYRRAVLSVICISRAKDYLLLLDAVERVRFSHVRLAHHGLSKVSVHYRPRLAHALRRHTRLPSSK